MSEIPDPRSPEHLPPEHSRRYSSKTIRRGLPISLAPAFLLLTASVTLSNQVDSWLTTALPTEPPSIGSEIDPLNPEIAIVNRVAAGRTSEIHTAPVVVESHRPKTKEERLAYGRSRFGDIFPPSVLYWVVDMEKWEELYGVPVAIQMVIMTNEGTLGNPNFKRQNADGSFDWCLFSVNDRNLTGISMSQRLDPDITASRALSYMKHIMDRYAIVFDWFYVYTAGASRVDNATGKSFQKVYASRGLNLFDAVIHKDAGLLTHDTKQFLKYRVGMSEKILAQLPAVR